MGCGVSLPAKIADKNETTLLENASMRESLEQESNEHTIDAPAASTPTCNSSCLTGKCTAKEIVKIAIDVKEHEERIKQNDVPPLEQEEFTCLHNSNEIYNNEHDNELHEHLEQTRIHDYSVNAENNNYNNNHNKETNIINDEHCNNGEQIRLSSSQMTRKRRSGSMKEKFKQPFARLQKTSWESLKNFSNSVSKVAGLSRFHTRHGATDQDEHIINNEEEEEEKARVSDMDQVNDYNNALLANNTENDHIKESPLLHAEFSEEPKMRKEQHTSTCIEPETNNKHTAKENKTHSSKNITDRNNYNNMIVKSNENDACEHVNSVETNELTHSSYLQDKTILSEPESECIIVPLLSAQENSNNKHHHKLSEESKTGKHDPELSESMLSDITMSDLENTSFSESNEENEKENDKYYKQSGSFSHDEQAKGKSSKSDSLDNVSDENATFLHHTSYTRHEDLELQRQQAPLSIEEDLFVYDDIVISKDEARTKHWRVAGRKPALAVDSTMYNWQGGNDGNELMGSFPSHVSNSNSSSTSSSSSSSSSSRHSEPDRFDNSSTTNSIFNNNNNSSNSSNCGGGGGGSNNSKDRGSVGGAENRSNANNYNNNYNINISKRRSSLMSNGLIGKRHSNHAVFSFTDFDVCVDEMDMLIDNSTNTFLSVFKSELSNDKSEVNSTHSLWGESVNSITANNNSSSNNVSMSEEMPAKLKNVSIVPEISQTSNNSNSIHNEQNAIVTLSHNNTTSKNNNSISSTIKLSNWSSSNDSSDKCQSNVEAATTTTVAATTTAASSSSTSSIISSSIVTSNNKQDATVTNSVIKAAHNISSDNASQLSGKESTLSSSMLSKCSSSTLSVISTLCHDKNSVKVYLSTLRASMPRVNRPLRNFTVDMMMGHASRVKCIAVTPSEKDYASCSNEDASVALYNLGVRSEIGIFTGHQDTVISTTFSADGKFLATTSKDKTMILWDVVTNKQLLTFAHNKVVICCAFSPDSKYLVSGCQDRICRLWDTRRGKEWLSYNVHEGIIIAITFSPDGSMVCSASADKTLRVWSTTTAKTRCTLTGHVGIILSCSYSGDGKFIISNDESYLRVWRSDDGQCILSLSPNTVASPLHKPTHSSTSEITTNHNSSSNSNSNSNSNNNTKSKTVKEYHTSNNNTGISNNNNNNNNSNNNNNNNNNNNKLAHSGANKVVPKLGWTLSVAAPGAFTNYVLVACNNRFVYVIDIRTGEEVASTFCKAPVYCLASGMS